MPKAKTPTQKVVQVDVPPIEIAEMPFKLIGTTPLICHRFGDAALEKMEEDQQGVGGPTKAKKRRDPKAEYQETIYPDSDGKPGFPASGFKHAMVTAAGYIRGLNAEKVKGMVFVLGDVLSVKFKTIRMRTDRVNQETRGGKKVVNLRYRAELLDWTCVIMVRFDEGLIDASGVANLLNRAGFSVGIGDWRPEKGGSYGQFSVTNA